MVHNGIEYADMQLIAEAYLLLKYVGGYDNAAISEIFHEWNQGELKSFLIGIAADIFAEDDEDGGQVLDKIVDAAGQKGTGRWTSIESMKQGVDISMITAACNARVMSNAPGRAKAQACIEKPALSHQHGDDFVEASARASMRRKSSLMPRAFPSTRARRKRMTGTSITAPLLPFSGLAASSRPNS